MKTGLIIGKFMPPHLGHKYLIDFARNYVDKLTVLVCSLKSEPISGELRFKWIKESFPGVDVFHLTDENPQEPCEHSDFWNIWKKSIFNFLPKGVDYLFASEDYGWPLAKVLGAKYIPVDHVRELLPVSGTAIRKDAIGNWKFILPAARSYFLKKVCIFGPESTGKSTLTKLLAKRFHTVYASEYARGLLNFKEGKCSYRDISLIAKGHMASEKALSLQADKILFSDTDMITTIIWSKVLFGKCPKWIERFAEEKRYDLYLLTDIDVPWVEDNQRYLPEKREWFFELCENELKKRGIDYVRINGDWRERLEKAVFAVERMLARGRG